MFLIQPLIAYTQPAGVETWKVVSLLKTPSVSHAAWISADDGWLVWRRVRWKKITWDFQINNSPSWNWDGKKNSRNCWPTLFDVWFYFVFEFLIFRFCFIFLNFAKNIITICVCVCVWLAVRWRGVYCEYSVRWALNLIAKIVRVISVGAGWQMAMRTAMKTFTEEDVHPHSYATHTGRLRWECNGCEINGSATNYLLYLLLSLCKATWDECGIRVKLSALFHILIAR